MAGLDVRIPYTPRPFQLVLHKLADKKRFGTIVCHRRFGKSVWAGNHLERAALRARKVRPRFFHVFPTYRQGKAVAWDYAKHFAAVVPGVQMNETELRIDFPNQGQYRIFGADNPDALRGLYADGVIFDEYGHQPPSIFEEVVRPLLSDRQGWAYFMGTPNGKNQFYKAKQDALANTTGNWFYAEYKASETGVLPATELADARAIMTEDEYAQEYECSFEASVRGAVFARELALAREQGRVTIVPYDEERLVDTDWDLGFGDATAIWFSQKYPGNRVHVIDYYEANGYALPHYRTVLSDKGYAYGEHRAPHDIEHHDIGIATGHTRLDVARQLGIPFRVMSRIERKEDAIHAARVVFSKCWFDSQKCAKGLEALLNYRWKPVSVEHPTGKPLPVHDWASHGADAFMSLGRGWYDATKSPERETMAAVRRAQRDEGETFRWNPGGFQRRGGY
jgi:hypothetical protein